MLLKNLTDLAEPLRELQQNDAPEEGLVIFDVDMTLTMNTNPVLHIKSLAENKAFLKTLKNSISPDLWTLLLNVAISETPNQLIKTTTPGLIEDLQKQGYKTFALTSLFSGTLGKKEPLEQGRYRELAALGVDFAISFSEMTSLSLTDTKPYRGNVPQFYKGVLCANSSGAQGSHKGDVLVSFLKKAKINPAYILFVDDREKELDNVKNALAEHFPKIRYQGLRYVGALSKPRLEKISSGDFEKAMRSFKTKAEALK